MTDPTPRGPAARPRPGRASVPRLLLVAVVLGLVAAAMWWAWLGWDHTYYEVDGVPQGPYRAWQVVGCGAAIVSACVLARVRARHWAGLLVLPAVATVAVAWPWSTDAAAGDSTGMWAVGLVMLLVGGFLGLLVVVFATDLVTDLLSRRRRNRPPEAPVPLR